MSRPYLSLIVPIYNEEAIIPDLLERILKVLGSLDRSWELVFVDDGSTDRSMKLLKEAQKKEPRIVIVELNRNFGQHSAVLCAFEQSRGEYVVTIDADLQNPPEEIPKILAKFEEGYDCVGTVRLDRQDSFFRKLASRMVNKIIRRLTGIALHDYGCMLRGYSREVADAMAQSREIYTFIPALGASLARKVCEIDVKHSARAAGKSKYNFFSLIGLQFDLLTSFSLKPIRLLTFLGLGIAMLALTSAAFLVIMRIIMGSEWAQFGVFTLFAALFFFIGAQFVVMGLLGEYIARIYSEVRKRPRFVVKEVHRVQSGELRPAKPRSV